MPLQYRFEAFASGIDPTVTGGGERCQCSTIDEVWAFLDDKLKDATKMRTFWIQDVKLHRFARVAMSRNHWRIYCPTPVAFEYFLDDYCGW